MPTAPPPFPLLRLYLSSSAIQRRVRSLGEQLTRDYAGLNPLLLCVLRGAFIFTADLARSIATPVQVDFLRASSYLGTESVGEPLVELEGLPESLVGRHVLLVEDVVDTGRTVACLREALERRGPASLRLCALLDKKYRREVEVQLHYSAFSIGEEFVVGYGLDLDQRYRHLPHIYRVLPTRAPPA
jgi:hypoxanthine phosphoribosyltransferase